MAYSLNTSEVGAFLSPRRSACDRCRRQKLRCPPSNVAGEPCARCSRLRASCVKSATYSRNAVGYRLHDRTQQPYIGRELRPKILDATGTVDGREEETVSRSSPDPIARAESWPFSTGGDTYSANPALLPWYMDDCDMIGATMGAEDHNDVDTPAECDIERGLLAFIEEESGPPDPSRPSMRDGHGPTESTSHGITGSIDVEDEEYVPHHGFPPSAPSPGEQRESRTKEITWDNRLSEICRRLSRRLDQMQGQDRSTTARNAAELQSPTEEDDTVTGRTLERVPKEVWSPKVFGEVLQDTSDFIHILKHRALKPEGNESFGIMIVLSLISAYMQLVSIYDHLLQSLCKQLQCSTSPSSAGANRVGNPALVLPSLLVAGVSIDSGTLQARLLVEIVVDRFVILQRILGLPLGLQVTGGNPQLRALGGHGLGSKDEVPTLLKEAECANGLLKVLGDHTRQVSVIYSLRNTIRRFQDTCASH